MKSEIACQQRRGLLLDLNSAAACSQQSWSPTSIPKVAASSSNCQQPVRFHGGALPLKRTALAQSAMPGARLRSLSPRQSPRMDGIASVGRTFREDDWSTAFSANFPRSSATSPRPCIRSGAEHGCASWGTPTQSPRPGIHPVMVGPAQVQAQPRPLATRAARSLVIPSADQALGRKRSSSPTTARCQDSAPGVHLVCRISGSSVAAPSHSACHGMDVGSSTAQSCESRAHMSSLLGASGSLSSSLSDSKETACDFNDLRLLLSASLAAQEQQRILQQKNQAQLAECMAELRASRQELSTVRREVEVLRQAHYSREQHVESLGALHERSGGSRHLSQAGLRSSDERWQSETPPRKGDHGAAGVAAFRESSPTASSAITVSPPGCKTSPSTTMTPRSAPRAGGQVMTPNSQHSSILVQNLIWCPASGGVGHEQQQQQISPAVPPMPLPLRSD